MNVEPVTLASNVVRLEPLGREHAQDLYEASQDQDIWTYMPMNPSGSYETLVEWITAANSPHELPFAIIDVPSGKPVGSTRYLNIAEEHFGLEIGWTWLGPQARRTAVNTECKYLLLQHAFESLHAIRVALKTDSRNLRSQRAIERLGAVREGVLRKQMILENGYQRDTVMYSIIDDEWPMVKALLQHMGTGAPV
ncbi:MAG: GNAT family N-acetyltransferase [Chloroflexi bacterium]|nr:MAG: GNAT family N-acetyltransferase [Chloroflexota bacterium]